MNEKVTRQKVKPLRERVQAAMAQLKATFVEREDAVDCIFTALVAGTNFLLVGDPGTAKTAIVRAAYSHITDARVFTTLCGAFATEDKIFGPLDIEKFKAGEYRRVTEGRLAGADLAFLDEMFKSNEGCLNGMLTALNERTYEMDDIPLVCCGAASNWPEVLSRTKTTAAIWDRLVLRCPVTRIGLTEGPNRTKTVDTTQLEKDRAALLKRADSIRDYKPVETFTLTELAQARAEASAIPVDDRTIENLVGLVSRLERDRVTVSDRRLAQMREVMRAASWLMGDVDSEGNPRIGLDAFDALRFGLWDAREEWLTVKVCIDTIDAAVVQQAVAKLQQAHRQAAQCTSPGNAPHALKQAADSSEEVKELLRAKGVRRSSMEKRIKPEVRKLQAEYERLKGQVAGGLAKKSPAKQDAAAGGEPL